MKKELLVISLTVFITVLIWIGVELYHTQTQKEFGKEYEKELQMVIKKIEVKKVGSLLKER